MNDIQIMYFIHTCYTSHLHLEIFSNVVAMVIERLSSNNKTVLSNTAVEGAGTQKAVDCRSYIYIWKG